MTPLEPDPEILATIRRSFDRYLTEGLSEEETRGRILEDLMTAVAVEDVGGEDRKAMLARWQRAVEAWNLPDTEEERARLRGAGWTIGETAFFGAAARYWIVYGSNGENVVRAEA
ncbi:hypothetical protein ACYOEI_29095, partial [Singulisphaera rosea]